MRPPCKRYGLTINQLAIYVASPQSTNHLEINLPEGLINHRKKKGAKTCSSLIGNHHLLNRSGKHFSNSDRFPSKPTGGNPPFSLQQMDGKPKQNPQQRNRGKSAIFTSATGWQTQNPRKKTRPMPHWWRLWARHHAPPPSRHAPRLPCTRRPRRWSRRWAGLGTAAPPARPRGSEAARPAAPRRGPGPAEAKPSGSQGGHMLVGAENWGGVVCVRGRFIDRKKGV